MPGGNVATITYTATRGIMAGHVVNTEYSFEVGLRRFDISRERKIEEAVSLSGRRFTTMHRTDQTASIETVPIDSGVLIDQFYEFLQSVEGGEVFEIDETGTIAAPVTPTSSKLKGNFSRNRIGRADRFTFAFEVYQ